MLRRSSITKMFKILALVILATTASAAVSSPRGFPWPSTGRIVGGEDTTIEEVPYQVSIRLYGRHNCGGSIISKDYVLTAGHCVGHILSAYTIVAGSSYRTEGGSEHSVEAEVRHKSYSTSRYGVPLNDIALLRVKEPFQLDETRQPIALFDQDEESLAGSLSLITGWGSTGLGSPSVLQAVTVPIVTKDSCNKAYKQFGGLPEGQICAAYPEGGKDACQGDSGGPLAINNRLAGITSWGGGCAVAGQPGVYTEVGSYRTWIKEKSGI